MKIAAVILAGGKGSRMKTTLPKALVELNGKALINYGIDSLKEIGIENIFIVYSKYSSILKERLSEYNFCLQEEALGAGDALRSSLEAVKDFDAVVVLSSDMPCIKTSSIRSLIDKFVSNNLDACYLTCITKNPTGYGRIIKENNLVRIVEEADVDSTNKDISEVNVATYMFKVKSVTKYINELTRFNKKEEYLITDLAYVLSSHDMKVDTCIVDDFSQFVGVNDLEALEEAKVILDNRK